MKKWMMLSALVLVVFAGCNRSSSDTSSNNQEAQNKSDTHASGKVGNMEDQVMALHEKTMQDMDSLMNLKKQLRESGGSAAENDSATANLHRLQQSYDDMMDWMNKYSEPDKNMPEDKAMTYMTDQLNKIENIYAETQRSIKQANDFLKLKK